MTMNQLKASEEYSLVIQYRNFVIAVVADSGEFGCDAYQLQTELSEDEIFEDSQLKKIICHDFWFKTSGEAIFDTIDNIKLMFE